MPSSPKRQESGDSKQGKHHQPKADGYCVACKELGRCLFLMVGRTCVALGLVTRPLPLELPPVPIVMSWHHRYDTDPAHAWLREQVGTVLSPGEIALSSVEIAQPLAGHAS